MSARMKRFVLIGSLLLNTFFISWVGSQWIKNRLTSEPLLTHLMQTAPAAARPVFLKHLRHHKASLLHTLQQLMSERDEINRLSQQSELDSAALEQALTQTTTHFTSAITQLQSAMLATMQELPPEVRQEWAKQWVQQRPLKNAQLAQTIKALAHELEQ